MRGYQARCAFLGALLGLNGCAGEPRVLPPRTPPPRAIPEVALPAAPPAAGHGRLVLDSTDGPMRVTAKHDVAFVPPGRTSAPSRTGELCTTPCVVDLPAGRYRLFMTSADASLNRGDTDDVVVEEALNVYVRAPGRYEPPDPWQIWPALLTTLGVGMLVVGAGLAVSDDTRTPGLILAGAGAGAGIGGGILWYDATRATRQEGATTIWRMPVVGPAPGGANP